MNKGFPNSYEGSSVEQNVRDESTDLQIKKLTDPTSSVEDLLSVMNQKDLVSNFARKYRRGAESEYYRLHRSLQTLIVDANEEGFPQAYLRVQFLADLLHNTPIQYDLEKEYLDMVANESLSPILKHYILREYGQRFLRYEKVVDEHAYEKFLTETRILHEPRSLREIQELQHAYNVGRMNERIDAEEKLDYYRPEDGQIRVQLFCDAIRASGFPEDEQERFSRAFLPKDKS